MPRIARSLPPLFAAVAASAVVAGFLGELRFPGWQILLMVAVAAAALRGTLGHGMPIEFALVIVLGGLGVASLGFRPELRDLAAIGPFDTAADIGVGLVLAVVLAVAVRRRTGELGPRDANDLATVALGATLAAWIAVTSDLIAEGGAPAVVAIGATLFLPISLVLFCFVVDLLANGLQHNRAMQAITASATLTVVAATGAGLARAGTIEFTRDAEIGLYVGAHLLLCAAISHPGAPRTIELAIESGPRSGSTLTRLGLTGLAVLVPGLLLAAVPSTGPVDTTVRVVVLLALLTSIMVRLRRAVRSHETSQRTLIDRLDHDDLTGLATRAKFVRIVDDALESTWRSEFRTTIVQLNLDGFKNINDSLGHAAANDVLAAVGSRLVEVARTFGADVGRIGGDDFAIVDATTRCDDDVAERVELVCGAFRDPFVVGERSVFVTASTGVATAPRSRTLTAEELLRRSDIATHRSKQGGRSTVSTFDDSMQDRLDQRMDIEHALHGAIGRQEMRLYYQPIVDLDGGVTSGFEALMRWQRDGAIVPPVDFIPIAEETGIIGELGAWALHEALRELRTWIDDGVVAADTTMSVNVSPSQIADPGFADVVRDAIDASGLPPERLWIEITESMILDEPELAELSLRRIRAMGVRIALDDFGTGYSSLSLLQRLPIDRIKIDRAFVNGIADDEHDRSLVRTVIVMARSMQLDVVAEGVETIDQLEGLADLACDRMQGYLVSRPVPAEAIRSTMVALDELSSLSLFSRTPAPHDVPHDVSEATPGPSPVVAQPVGVVAASRPMSRPLGQPVL